jgi:hypothetical protein
MPNLLHSITVHRLNLQTIWRSKEWKEANKIFHSLHPDNKCERCGMVGVIVPGHCDEDYNDMSTYISKVRENKVEALCPKCNRKQQKGMKPCPLCIKAYQITNGERWIRYIPQFMENCNDCADPAEREMRKVKKIRFRKHVRVRRDQQNERDRIARRPYQDAQNLKRKLFYQTVVKKR